MATHLSVEQPKHEEKNVSYCHFSINPMPSNYMTIVTLHFNIYQFTDQNSSECIFLFLFRHTKLLNSLQDV